MLTRRPSLAAGPMPLLRLKGRRLATVLGALALASALVQLLLGASPAVVALSVIAAGVGLIGFAALGPYNVGAWLGLFYVLGNVLVALYAKTLLGQPLDSYLYAPLSAFLALAITSIALFAAMLLSRKVGLGRPLFSAVADPRLLRFLSWGCFGLGVIFWLLNRRFQDPDSSGFGGLALFRDLLLMAVIARTAMLLEQTSNRRSFDSSLGLILVASVFMGLVDNGKAAAGLPVISYFATVLFYRRGIPRRSAMMLAVGGVAFVIVLAPAVHALRALGQQDMSLSQRIDFVATNAINLLEAPQQLSRYEQLAAGQFESGYYNYFGDIGTGQMVLGRYASVQQIDPVIAEVDRQGARGGAAIWPAFLRLLPSFVYPDKPEYIEDYHTLVHYRLIVPEGGKFPTLPLAGQVYAAYGMAGLLFIPFLTFLGFLLAAKKLGWGLYRNVYAIFFLCQFVFVYASQGSFGHYAGAVLRSFPLYAAVFWLLALAYRMRVGRRSRVVRPPLASAGVELQNK